MLEGSTVIFYVILFVLIQLLIYITCTGVKRKWKVECSFESYSQNFLSFILYVSYIFPEYFMKIWLQDVDFSNITSWVRYSITSNLRIYQKFGKNMFSLGKMKPWTHWEFCSYCKSLSLGKALNIYINYLMFYPSRQHIKCTGLPSNDFMMNLTLFSLTCLLWLICWWQKQPAKVFCKKRYS